MTAPLRSPQTGVGAQPALSILIVSHGHADLVRACLVSLTDTALAGLTYEIIVIDNLAEPDFLERIGGTVPGLILKTNDTQLGFGANMNRAAARARGRVLLLLNPDTAHHEGQIASAVAWLEADTTRGIVAARLLNSDMTEQRNFRQFPTMAVTLARGLHAERWNWRPRFYRDSLLEAVVVDTPTKVDWAYGSCMLIRSSTFRAMGGFDEGFFMYYEDVDLCRRLGRAGLGCFAYPQLSFTHHHQRTSAADPKSIQRRHHIRSFLRYLRLSHAYFVRPAAAQPMQVGTPPAPPRRLTQFCLAALTFGSIQLAGEIAAQVYAIPRTDLLPEFFGLFLLMAQFMLQEYDPARLGDTPRRVVGVVESGIMAVFPWALVLIVWGTAASAGVVAVFIALALILTASTTYALTLAVPSEGARIGVVFEADGPGLAAGLPTLPIGLSSVVRVFPFAEGQQPQLTQSLHEAIRTERIDHLLIVLDRSQNAQTLSILYDLAMFDLPIWHALGESDTQSFSPHPRSLLLRGAIRSRAREAMKRGLDLVLSFAALTILALPMGIVALLIWLEDRGPVFFSQIRDGRNQVPFPMLKFRSMYAAHSDSRGDKLTTKNDERITRIGAFLRRTSFDELPQLLNVVAGQMSIVGPRPLPVGFHYKGLAFETFIPEWHHRHRVRPGITGLSQLKGLRGTPDSSAEATQMMTDRVLFDNLYVDHWTIWLDLRIIAMTAISGAFMSGSY